VKWLIALLLMAACSAPLSGGRVVDHQFIPTHSEPYTTTELGCGFGWGTDYDGDYTYEYGCGRMIIVTKTRIVADAWFFTIEGIDPDNGETKHRTITVDHATFDVTPLGGWYEVPQ